MGLENVQVLESTKSIFTLNQIKDFSNQLKKLQSETGFWLSKQNEYGQQKKYEAMTIFIALQRLCEKSGESAPLMRSKTMLKDPSDEMTPEERKLQEDYILFDIYPVEPDSEN